jgi:hypothetical protein
MNMYSILKVLGFSNPFCGWKLLYNLSRFKIDSFSIFFCHLIMKGYPYIDHNRLTSISSDSPFTAKKKEIAAALKIVSLT